MANANLLGVEITLGAEKFMLPPLPLIRMSGIRKLMEGGDIHNDSEYVDCLVDAIHWSLLRNYPEFDRNVVANNLDLTNFHSMVATFMDVNQMARKDADPSPLGEALASQ